MNSRSASPNLDFMRTAAVLFVVAFHILMFYTRSGLLHKEALRGLYSVGNWGVLVFFVHTSLVLMFSLRRDQSKAGRVPRYIPFLIRRVFRVYPLSMVIVLCVALLNLPVSDIQQGRFVAASLDRPGLLANFLLIQNVTSTDSIIAPLWSLPYELQMYLLLPLLFGICESRAAPAKIGAIWMLAAGLTMLIQRNQLPPAISLLEFLPNFIPGVLAYTLTFGRTLRLPSYLWPIAFLLITAIYLGHPSDHRGALACLLLGLAIPQFKELQSPPLRRVCHVIAQYSYGIYLTHFVCLWIAFDGYVGLAPVWQWTVLLATTAALPVLFYHLIEKPMMQVGAVLAARMGALRVS